MKKIKVVVLISSIVLLVGLLSGCSVIVNEANTSPGTPSVVDIPVETAVTPADGPFSVVDALGRTVAFEKQPRNIVIVGKATTLLNNAIFLFPEAPERVLSYEQRLQTDVDFITTMFEGMAGKTLLARDATAEQVAPLQPDLVILKTYMREKIGMPIETLGIPVIYLDLETPEQFYIDLRTIGQVFGNPAHAETLIEMYKANEARIADALSGLEESEKPFVLLLEYKNKGGEFTFSVPPLNYLQTVIVERAGGVPVWKEVITDGGWTVVTLEQVAAWNPDIIFIVDYSAKAVEVVAGLKQDPKWQAMGAVSNGKIYAFPADFLSWDQPDPRWGLGELWLASRIHPDRFPGFDLQAEVRQFYADYYNLDAMTIDEKILPLLAADL
jgi:iron complex transport system substrate-binding protein